MTAVFLGLIIKRYENEVLSLFCHPLIENSDHVIVTLTFAPKKLKVPEKLGRNFRESDVA